MEEVVSSEVVSDKLLTPAPRDSENPRVLIVDDSPETTRALASLLKRAEYLPAVCHRGMEAIEYARQHLCAAAVVDVHLPDVSGLLVAQKLRESFGPRVPIVVLSGDTSMSVLNSLPHVGANYFFSKPVNAALLLTRLGEWIAESRAGGEAKAG
jgi:DNA-binding response OmpR family regulator